jgi:mycofactocin glycosyltransferase
MLARRLLDAGLVQPDPTSRSRRPQEVTIVVPVYGRGDQLERCLAGMSGQFPTIVVDDASPDGGAIAAVAERFGARYVRHGQNRGAAAARNTGLGLAATPIVAFIDADCIPPATFPGDLLGHLGWWRPASFPGAGAPAGSPPTNGGTHRSTWSARARGGRRSRLAPARRRPPGPLRTGRPGAPRGPGRPDWL